MVGYVAVAGNLLGAGVLVAKKLLLLPLTLFVPLLLLLLLLSFLAPHRHRRVLVPWLPHTESFRPPAPAPLPYFASSSRHVALLAPLG